MIGRLKKLLKNFDPQEVKRELARRSLLDFIKYTKPDYETNWHHEVICNELEDFIAGDTTRLILCVHPRSGKALEINTPIPTPEGWKRIADLAVGDFVFDETGAPTRVCGKSPIWTDRALYRVRTDDGEEVIADAAHEWIVRLCRKRKRFGKYETKFLAERESTRAPMLKKQGALVLPEINLPIDPYVLGVWLGNGRNSGGVICEADQEVIDNVLRLEGGGDFYAPKGVAQHFRPGPNARSDGVKASETLTARLRSLGLIGNKHIPLAYLRASQVQRLKLLQGLIDTDGYVGRYGHIEFCSTCKKLAENVRELVHSLGYKASFITGRAMLNGRDCGEKYRVMFFMKNAALLSRKRKKTRDAERTPNHYLTFEPAGRGDTVCIEVESSSHMFLCGRGMIPTCNSEIVSRRLPAYIHGRLPDTRIIACSYASDLAQAMNRDVQRIIDSPEYAEVFPGTTLNGSNIRTTAKGNYLRNSDVFEVVGHKGMYLSAGVGGGITGRGFDIGIIDDPIKNREEANSPTIREKVWDWYTSTFYTRREKNAKILIIMTRWHEDDLVGRLIEQQKQDPHADQWKIVVFPAIFEGRDEFTHSLDQRAIGEALWPSKFNEADLQKIESILGSFEWAGLYQQKPVPSGGGIFQRDWWAFYDRAPQQFDEIIQSWDMTFKDADTSDYVVGQVWGRIAARYYLLDQVRDRMDFPRTIREVKKLSEKWPRATVKLVEDKANGPAVIATLKKDLHGLIAVSPNGGKEARASAVSPLVESGNVYLPRNAPWVDAFLSEVNSFPNAKHDDQVDAMSQALNRLALKSGKGYSASLETLLRM